MHNLATQGGLGAGISCVPSRSRYRAATGPFWQSRHMASVVHFCGDVVAESGRDRSFRYARDIAKVALGFASRSGCAPIADQLMKAGTSIGANLEEAKAGSSRREFVRYVDIALREARESVYWLRLCVALELEPKSEIERLRNEGEQLARILGAIVVKTKARRI